MAFVDMSLAWAGVETLHKAQSTRQYCPADKNQLKAVAFLKEALMPVDETEFNRIIGNLLKTPPKKHADSKLGKRKTSGKIILPKKEAPAQKQGSGT